MNSVSPWPLASISKQEMFQKHICPPWSKILVYFLCRSKMSEASRQGIKIYKVYNILGSKEWFGLDLWTCDLKINKDYLLIKRNPCTKFGIEQVKGSKDIERTRLGLQTDIPTDRQTVAKRYIGPLSQGGIIKEFLLYMLYVKFDKCGILAHLSWKPKWAFLITSCPASVRPSINFSHFDFFSRTTGPISTILNKTHPWMKGIQVGSNGKEDLRFYR